MKTLTNELERQMRLVSGFHKTATNEAAKAYWQGELTAYQMAINTVKKMEQESITDALEWLTQNDPPLVTIAPATT